MLSGSGLVQLIPVKYIYWACGGAFSTLAAIAAYVAKHVYNKVEEANVQITDISSELTLQRTNCLSTLQKQGETQIILLQSIAESVSYLKGKNDA